MAGKRRPFFGADFNDDYMENGTPKRTKKSSSASDDEKDYIGEMNRIISVMLFAVGILTALITIIPGSAGWSYMHNALWGICGWAVFGVPFMIMYVSVLIGLEKSIEEITAKIFWGLGWIVLASSTIQIFAIGSIPGEDLLSYIISLYKAGVDFRGGGVISLPLAGLLFVIFGKMGARIVIILLVCVLFLLLTGKGIIDIFNIISTPFKSLFLFFDSDDSVEDDDADEDYYNDEVFNEKENNEFREYEEINQYEDTSNESDSHDYTFHGAGEQRTLTEEEEEFRTFFDIPLPDEENNKYANMYEESSRSDGSSEIDIPIDENSADCNELDILINNAAKKTAKSESVPAESEKTDEEDEQKQLYVLPSLELLALPNNKFNSEEAIAEMREKADTIVKTFDSFSVKVEIVDIFRGPSITRYEVKPGAGVKVSKIKGLEDDIALSLAAQGVRIEAPVPGKSAVGIEVPNINKDTVTLREILASKVFGSSESKLTFAVGKDIAGNEIVGDITKMPHVIIAGTTGSGKSVCTRSIIMSILYNATPDEVKIILIDPKVVEFKVFEGIPHLLIPIVTEAKKAAGALNWAVNEMMRRYNTFADVGANDLKSYNELAEEDEDLQFLPQIVIFIDELADMMLVAGKEVEDSICRLAQMGRAAGMHLVVATQRPTTDVITGLIKANIPSRIALSVKSQIDSRTILDMAGADKLLGNGDMLYMPIGVSKPVRVQGCFASAKDINNTLDFIRSQATCSYNAQIIEAVENFVPQTKGDRGGSSDSGFSGGTDEDYIIRGAEVAVNAGQLSTTMLQKKLKLGYARASRIMDELEERGIVAASEGAKPRKVLMSKMQFDEWKMRQLEDK